jgi:hypothetical protein
LAGRALNYGVKIRSAKLGIISLARDQYHKRQRYEGSADVIWEPAGLLSRKFVGGWIITCAIALPLLAGPEIIKAVILFCCAVVLNLE